MEASHPAFDVSAENDMTNDGKGLIVNPQRFRGSMWTLACFWTLAVALVLTWETYDARVHAERLRQGVSVKPNVNLQEIHEIRYAEIRDRFLGYGAMWLLGIAGIMVFSRHLRHQFYRRCEAEQKLHDANERLEQRVAERTGELAEANGRLENEIDERRKAEQWLLESESRFRSIFEQGLIGMAMLSPHREWIEVNDHLCRMLGYTQDELILTPWDKLTHPDDLAAEKSQYQTLLDGLAAGFKLEKRLIRKNQEVVSVHVSAQCLRAPDGKLDCVLLAVQENANRD
jgi:PAS domain S-box-containing protein